MNDGYSNQDLAIGAVLAERDRQDYLWGSMPRNKTAHQWLSFLTEELGEVAKAINEHESYERVKEELVHVAAVAVAAIEDGDIRYAEQISAARKDAGSDYRTRDSAELPRMAAG